MAKTIALVGHCNYDGPMLQKLLTEGISGADVLRINTDEALTKALDAGVDLLLINREPVGFDGEGIDMIGEIRRRTPSRR